MSKKPRDNRLVKSAAPEMRGDRAATADASRQPDLTAYDEDEYRELIKNEFMQEALPRVEDRDGWHFCWLSATSSYDPIHKRIRLGYVPVKLEEVDDGRLKDYKITGGEYAGGVQCNEMILFKIRRERYQIIMEELHHRAPLRDEEAVRQKTLESNNQRDRKGRQLLDVDDEDEGFRGLGNAPVGTPPVFS